jgi:protein-tyrosine phosphatase
MAEAIARRDAADVMEASSAGLAALGFVAGPTLAVLHERGYVVEELRSKGLRREMYEQADLVINMSGRPKEEIFTAYGKVQDWDVEDPYGADLEIYRRICEDIEERVRELAERIRAQGSKEGRRE